MAVDLIRVAYGVTVGDPIAKAVLVAMADSGCKVCGFAWPGVAFLEKKTELGATAIRRSLAYLVKQGLVHPHGYRTGGRGRATEYVVLSSFIELSTAPCEGCVERMSNPPRADGYGAKKPTASRGVSAKPIAKRAENPSRGGDHPLSEPYPSGEKEPTASRPAASDLPPLTPEENARRARDLANALGAHMSLDRQNERRNPSEGEKGARREP